MSSHYSWADAAVEALGAHGGPEAIGMLQDILSNEQNPRIDAGTASGSRAAGAPRFSDKQILQRRAGMALGRNASDAAVATLRSALKSDDADRAVGAACGLEMLGGKPGLELAALALADTDAGVHKMAASGPAVERLRVPDRVGLRRPRPFPCPFDEQIPLAFGSTNGRVEKLFPNVRSCDFRELCGHDRPFPIALVMSAATSKNTSEPQFFHCKGQGGPSR